VKLEFHSLHVLFYTYIYVGKFSLKAQRKA
jgi:hypothetical protein